MQIEDELPVIDGATALYPIYAAFAQAVYPEKEYQPYNSEVMSNRTGVAYSNLINGKVDIIFALEPSAHQLNMAEKTRKRIEVDANRKRGIRLFRQFPESGERLVRGRN